MAAAVQTLDVEPTKLNWLTVLADDGKVYRYDRRQNADANAVAHIEGQYLGGAQIRAVVVKDQARKPLLRQEGVGLPATLVVDYVQPSPARTGVSSSYWTGKVQYELVRTDYQYRSGDRVRHPHKGDGTVTSLQEDEGSVIADKITYAVQWDAGGLPEPQISARELTRI